MGAHVLDLMIHNAIIKAATSSFQSENETLSFYAFYWIIRGKQLLKV